MTNAAAGMIKWLRRAGESLFRRARTENAVNESGDHYRHLVEMLPDAIYVLTEDRFVYSNPAGVHLFGARSAEEFLDRLVLDRVHPEYQNDFKDKFSTLLNQESSLPELKGIFLRMDGSSFHAELAASPTIFAGKKSMFVLVRDISQQIQSERLLEQYRGLSENSRDVIWYIRISDGAILDANLAAEKVYGYTQEEFKKLTLKDIRAQETLSDLEFQLKSAETDGITMETLHIRKNGEKFPVEVSAQGITVNGEKVLLSIIHDISERRATEEQIQKQLGEITQRTQELEAITEVSVAMRNATTRLQMVPLLIEQASRVTKAQAGALILVNENTLVIHAATGSYSEHLGRRINNQENLLWEILRSGQIKVLPSSEVPSYASMGEQFPDFTREVMTITFAPLRAGPSAIGLLVLGFQKAESTPTNQTRLISAIADMAGSTLHRMSTNEMMEKIVTDRTRELEHIYQVSSAASTATDLKNALQQALDQTLQAIGGNTGLIYLLQEDEQFLELIAYKGLPNLLSDPMRKQPIEGSIPGWVAQHKEPLILPDLAADPRASSYLHSNIIVSFAGIPMRVQSRVVGILGITKAGRESFNLEEMMLLSFIADHIGLVVDHFHLYQQAEKSAILEERSRMARELHDSVTQSLYSASLFSSGALKYLEKGQINQTKDYLLQLGQVTQQALKEMRLLVYELRSSDLRSGGLVRALQMRLEAVERRSGMKTSLHANALPKLDERLEQDLYRIALEALNNALKHSEASEVELNIKLTDEIVHLSIHDNGKGFDLPELEENGGMGLSSMRERALSWGGGIEINSESGRGCNIVVFVPATASYEISKANHTTITVERGW